MRTSSLPQSRRSLHTAPLALACFLGACADQGAAPAASSATAAAPKPSTSAAITASATASAAASAPAPAASIDTASFGPDISKTAVEAFNASTGFEFNPPQAALDGKPTTSWSAPSAPQAWFEVSFLPGTKVDGIELGGQRTDKTGTEERWLANAVIKRVRAVWDGGSGELTFSRATDKGVRKRLGIGAVTRRVRLEILEVEPGTKSSDVDIDELGIFGTAPSTKAAAPDGLTGLCRGERLAVRFNNGAVVGGEWTEKPDDLWRWTFYPIVPRADDGEWHTLGVRYVEDSEVDFNGEKVVKTKNAGKIFRFRATGDTFEVDQDGAKATGKCEKK